MNMKTPSRLDNSWKDSLVIVELGTQFRLLGIQNPQHGNRIHCCVMLTSVGLRPGGNGISMSPPIALPYDGMGVVNEVDLESVVYILRTASLEPSAHEYYVETYLNIVDPPRITVGGPGTPSIIA